MATTGTYTTRDLVEDALRKIGVVAIDDPMTADESAHALRALDRLMKSWQNREYSLWLNATQTLTLTTSASYTLSPVRPLRILNARLVRSGIETPMQELTREEYDDLPLKSATGVPTTFYYDRQREASLFYVWPVLAAANGETIKIAYEREFEDQTDLTAVPDVPGEWWDAVVYGLAARLADDYGKNVPNVVARAEEELRLALSADREGSIYFGEPA